MYIHHHSVKISLVVIQIFAQAVLAQDDSYRLPPNYLINHYSIDLTVPAESFTANSNNYSGAVNITFQVTVQTNEMKLHASPAHITLLTIQLNGSDYLTSSQYSVNNTTDILSLQFATDLIVGQIYSLELTFNGTFRTSNGFYKASYTDHNNEVQYIATTQFEPTRARYAFPCFDEPVYKATFAYKLTYPSSMNALTNSPAVSTTTNVTTGLTSTQFDTTPRMSVYLVAFIISKYTCTTGALEGSSSNVHRLCSRQDKEYARNFSLYLTPRVIDHLNSYTGINFTESLPELNQVAVSGKGGAMENWGLVLYSESGLLFDNTIQTNSDKQGILAVIAHELAHQWFGNLVTCKWWSEIFLNEGFATLYEYYTANSAAPEFEMEKQFVIRIQHYVLPIDGYLDVPALRSNASTPTEISAKFGTYSYYKGAGVLRMIEHVLGRETFRKGISKYLTDNAYQSAEPQNLWDALSNVTENEVSLLPGSASLSDVVDSWINKGGHPVVNVSIVGSTVVMTQQRFVFSGTDAETRWYIPISYTTPSIADYNENTAPKGWITPSANFTITGFSSNDWVVVNNQQTGFYRVNYDSTLWNNLATALKQSNFSGIHVLNRAQIVDDSHNLAKAGQLAFSQVLRNTEFLANDTSYFTWYPAISFFSYLLPKVSNTTRLGAALISHFVSLISTAAESVPLTTVNEEDHIFTINQLRINGYACQYGIEVCVSGAKSLFATYKASHQRPNINTRSIVYCNAIRHSDDPTTDWSFLYEQYQNSSVSQDASTIWSALGCASDTAVLNSFLQKILENDTVVTSARYNAVFSSIYQASELGVDRVLDFFINNYQAIIDKYATFSLDASAVLTGLGSYITKTSQIQQLRNFIDSATGLNASIVAAANSAIATATSNLDIVNGVHKSDLYGYFGLAEDEDTTSSTSTTLSTTTASTVTTTQSTTISTTQGTTPSTGGADAALSHFSIISFIIVSICVLF